MTGQPAQRDEKTDGPENMVSVAAAGAGSLASIISVLPLGALMAMNWPPPSPEAAGLKMP